MRTAVSLLDRANRMKDAEEIRQLLFEACDEIERLEGNLEVSQQQTRHMMRQLCAYPSLTQ